jgi:CDP-diacylglycerol--serine O-phosphatidyltransferase
MARRKARMVHGVFLLPMLFTAGNLALGSLGLAMLHERAAAGALACAVLVLAAAVLDSFDGRIARATNATSPFGMEFDSMADVISFGVAPAWLAYAYGMQTLGIAGAAAAIWYTMCVAFRLARFNATGQNRVDGFVGLPCPAAAATIASFVLLMETLPRLGVDAVWVPSRDVAARAFIAPWLAVGLAVLGWLMVSSTPYMGFKRINLARPKPLGVAVGVIVFFFVMGALPQLLFGIFLLYVLTGILARFLVRIRWAEVVAPAWVEWAERRLAGSRHATVTDKLDR